MRPGHSMDTRNILISVKEQYAQKIKLGIKCVELRKYFPAGKEGARVYVYVPAPRKEIIGYFCIEKITRLPIDILWKADGKKSSLSEMEFFTYFTGKKHGIAIHFKKFIQLHATFSLDYIRKIHPKFCPPQSYIYLNTDIENLFFAN